MSDWPFQNFERSEFRCPCCGFDAVDLGLVTTLQYLRTHTGRKIIVISGCRCPSHNVRVKGSNQSQHLVGRAADFYIDGLLADQVRDMVRDLYRQYKIYVGYLYKISWRSLHLDVRTPESLTVRRWRQ